MTVATTINRVRTAGNGVTTSFPTTGFVFFDETELQVYIVDTTATPETETLKTLTTHYTVTGGNGATGTVEMITPPTSDEDLLIIRVLPFTQATDLVNNSISDAEVLEEMADRVVMALQQLQEQIDRSITLPISSTLTDLEIPEPAALEHLRWNSGATALENVDVALLGAIVIEDPTTPGAGHLCFTDGTQWKGADDTLTYLVGYDNNSATVGPNLKLARGRGAGTATAADILGALYFQGEDAGGNATDYATLQAVIVDPTDTSEDGRLDIYAMIAGTSTKIGELKGSGINVLTGYAFSENDVAFGPSQDTAWSGAQRGTFFQCTDAATVAVDFANGNNQYVTITAARTIGAPSNVVNGQSGYFIVEQDTTGGWQPSWNAAWLFKDGTAPTVDTTANSKALIAYVVDWDSEIHCTFIGDF